MTVCAKCGFENEANVKICANCLTDLHWAKVNLGKFQGNADDTRRIGIESRKERGILMPDNDPKPQKTVIPISSPRKVRASSLWLAIGCLVLGILAVFPYVAIASWYMPRWHWISNAVFGSLGPVVFFSGFFLGIPSGIAGIILGVLSLRRSPRRMMVLIIAVIGIVLSIAGVYGHYWFFATCQFCQ